MFWQTEERAVRFNYCPPYLLASHKVIFFFYFQKEPRWELLASYKVILNFQKEPRWEDKSPTWMLMSFLSIVLPHLLYLDHKQISTMPLPWWGISRGDQWIARKGPCTCVKSQLSLMLVLSKQVKYHLGFPGGSEVTVSAWNAGNPGSIPGLGRSPGEGNGNPLQYSCLENPMEGGTWWAMGLQRVGHDWATLAEYHP